MRQLLRPMVNSVKAEAWPSEELQGMPKPSRRCVNKCEFIFIAFCLQINYFIMSCSVQDQGFVRAGFISSGLPTQPELGRCLELGAQEPLSPVMFKYRQSAVSTNCSPQDHSEAESEPGVSYFHVEEACMDYADRCYCRLGPECQMSHCDEPFSQPLDFGFAAAHYPQLTLQFPKRSRSYFF